MTYELLAEIAWKSLLTSGAALLILRLLKQRSAAERSWIATAGVIATLLLPLAALLGPRWRVETPEAVPAILVQSPQAAAPIQSASSALEAPAPAVAQLSADASTWLSSGTLGLLLYAVPAAILLLVTLLGVLRLYLLRARSEVLVQQDWIAALARAQRRMQFKHGTALLVSDDLSSPISWGFFRPTIVLNSEALESKSQAEPIIAHELAHVARFDWAKLILGRAASALFWFNPLVWVLVRESHQLCEEAADDAVLAAQVPCTEYASLLVEVASHNSRGMAMAANGVAPGPASLKQRVARILNPHLSRNPARVGWAAACVATAAVAFTPLAAIAPMRSLPLVEALQPRQAHALPSAARAVEPNEAAAPEQVNTQLAEAEVQLLPEQEREVDLQESAVEVLALPDAPAATVPIRSGSTLSLASFNAVELQGGGNVVLRHGPRQQVRIASGSIQPHQLSVENGGRLFVRCGRGCTAKNLVVEVTTPNVQALAISGGGTVQASGSFPVQGSLALAIHGGGTLDARGLQASNTAAAIHGGGTIMTRAVDQLAASTHGGGEIRYWGDGDVLSAIQGGGKIEPGGT